MNRREFLHKTTASAAFTAMLKSLPADAASTVPARLTIQPDRSGFPIPQDFLGLSYESAQLAHPEFFSAQNRGYSGSLRALGPNGVLRLGGGTVENEFWTPHPTQTGSAKVPDAVGPDKRDHGPIPTQTTPKSVRNLREFLDAIQWRCI